MARQPDLLSQDGLTVTPAEGRRGPRIWIRRLAVWRDPEAKPLQDITLRPGLNIVWSPDGTEQSGTDLAREAMGHGGGKTLFCRLLRYCLGEPRFASEDQRNRIAETFPDGLVGAEIVLDGRVWSVIRPFAPRRRHLAKAHVTLEEALQSDESSDGVEPFSDAVIAAFFSSDVAALVPGGAQNAWLIALAWLTRDQECRLHHVLDWRSTESDSDSPARGLGKAELLDALRVFLKALDPDEQKCRQQIAEFEARKRALEQERDHLAWLGEGTRSRLARELGVPEDQIMPGRMSVAPLKEAATRRLTAAQTLESADQSADIAALRQLRDEAQAELTALLERQARIEAEIPASERIIARIRGEVPGLSYGQFEAENPACPVCDVPIDRVLAERCNLSHKLPDLQTIRQRREKAQQDLDAESASLSSLNSEKLNLLPSLALARQKLGRYDAQLRKIDESREATDAARYSAKRAIDDVATYDGSIQRHEAVIGELRSIEEEIKKLSDKTAAYRRAQASVFARLTEKFDAIMRELVGPNAKGFATLSGKGLDLRIDLGGTRSTAAIESLKIIAFDLAALVLSIEGHAVSPEFLLHDSPREADMGGPLYHRIFELVRSLEAVGEEPRFQYIITTTSKPPSELAQEPWLRLELKGFPAERRLLKCDL